MPTSCMHNVHECDEQIIAHISDSLKKTDPTQQIRNIESLTVTSRRRNILKSSITLREKIDEEPWILSEIKKNLVSNMVDR